NLSDLYDETRRRFEARPEWIGEDALLLLQHGVEIARRGPPRRRRDFGQIERCSAQPHGERAQLRLLKAQTHAALARRQVSLRLRRQRGDRAVWHGGFANRRRQTDGGDEVLQRQINLEPRQLIDLRPKLEVLRLQVQDALPQRCDIIERDRRAGPQIGDDGLQRLRVSLGADGARFEGAIGDPRLLQIIRQKRHNSSVGVRYLGRLVRRAPFLAFSAFAAFFAAPFVGFGFSASAVFTSGGGGAARGAV